MAICADDLTARDLCLDARKPVSLAHQERDSRSLVIDVIELQHKRIGETTVCTARSGQKTEHVASRFSPPAVARGACLAAVQFSASADVPSAALLALGLLSVKVGASEAPPTCPTDPCVIPARWLSRRGVWPRRRSGGRGLNAPRPDARRAERHPKVKRDGAHRPAFGSKSSSIVLFPHLRPGHTNTCSQDARTC
jgi:hypothetical protein